MLSPLLDFTINEHTLILFLAKMFQKLKFKLLHHYVCSVDLTVCDSHFFWTAEKIITWLLIFKIWERMFFSDGTEKLVDQCVGSPCSMLCPTALFYFNIEKW